MDTINEILALLYYFQETVRSLEPDDGDGYFRNIASIIEVLFVCLFSFYSCCISPFLNISLYFSFSLTYSSLFVYTYIMYICSLIMWSEIGRKIQQQRF